MALPVPHAEDVLEASLAAANDLGNTLMDRMAGQKNLPLPAQRPWHLVANSSYLEPPTHRGTGSQAASSLKKHITDGSPSAALAKSLPELKNKWLKDTMLTLENPKVESKRGNRTKLIFQSEFLLT